MAIELESYKEKGKYPLPDDKIDPKKKADQAYYLSCAKHFYSLYQQNETLYSPNSMKSIDTLRAYGSGNQDIMKYIDQLYPEDSFQRKRNMSFGNISRDIVKVIPKFKNTLFGLFLQQEYEYLAAFIDPSSSKMKDEEKAWLKFKLNASYQEFSARVGLKASKEAQDEQYPKFSSKKQVDIFFESGGFQLPVEIAIKNMLDLTLDDSSWENVLITKFFNDILDIGVWAVEDYVDSDYRVKGRYIDPKTLVCPNIESGDNPDMDFGGFMGKVSLSEIRNSRGLDDKDLIDITKAYSGQNGNTAHPENLYGSKSHFNQNGYYPNDGYKIDVMTMYWISPDTEKYTVVKHRKDKTNVVNSVDHDYELNDRSKKDGKELKESSVDYIYKCKWIVGTNYVYDYGKLDFVPREIKKASNGRTYRRARLPIHVTKLEGPSMVDLCVSAADQIQLDTMKLRMVKTKIPNAPAVFVVKEALENITIGNIKMTPRDIMDMFQDDGWGVMNRLDDFSNPTGAGNPIVPIDISNVYNLVKTYREEIGNSFNDIRLITGISEIVDGSTPAPRTGLGIATMSANASSNSVYLWKQCYEIGFLNFLKNSVLRWQIVNQTEDIDAVFRPYGSETTKTVAMVKGSLNGECALRVRIRSTAEERNMLIQEAAGLKTGRVSGGGVGGITPAQYILVSNAARGGNLVLAQLLLANAEEETRVKDMQVQQAMAEGKASLDQESAQAASKAQQETLAFEHKLKMEFMIKEQEEIRKTKIIEKGLQRDMTLDNTRLSNGIPVQEEEAEQPATNGYAMPPAMGAMPEMGGAPGMEAMPEMAGAPGMEEQGIPMQ